MPASPRSPSSATGKHGEPLDLFLDAAESQGLAVDLRQVVSKHGGVNPTRVDLRMGPHITKLLVYSWYMTLEGHGRGKDDFRIQTTRAHGGPLMSERGRSSVGIGWRREDKVFVAFDAWAKRYTGASSSVHIKRDLVNSVKKTGTTEGGMTHDPRFGFDTTHVADFVRWALTLDRPKVAALAPHEWNLLDDNHAEVVGSVHSSLPTSWLREKDRVIIVDKNKNVTDPGLWQIRGLGPEEEKTPAGRPRRFIRFDCRRVGKVQNLPQSTLDAL